MAAPLCAVFILYSSSFQHKHKVLLELKKLLRTGIFEMRGVFLQLLDHSLIDLSRFPTAVCSLIIK